MKMKNMLEIAFVALMITNILIEPFSCQFGMYFNSNLYTVYVYIINDKSCPSS